MIASGFCRTVGMTDDEFLALWSTRYVRADGSARAAVGRVLNALSVIRGPAAAPVGFYDEDRRRR
jgi:hypothetical protein